MSRQSRFPPIKADHPHSDGLMELVSRPKSHARYGFKSLLTGQESGVPTPRGLAALYAQTGTESRRCVSAPWGNDPSRILRVSPLALST